tara:strand:+ start:728 stop:1573 length:846 start_codon:yes stop_codon:yes gene_type:complete
VEIISKEFVIKGSSDRDILIDISFKKNNLPKEIIIFSHGFKGFKDWGAFNYISKFFAKNNYVFLKFNFSHNGTTVNHPCEFNDLDAFSKNNFCKELDDLNLVLNWIFECDVFKKEVDFKKIILFGHSRGGAISILKSAEDNRLSKIISWSAPSNLLSRLPVKEKVEVWKKTNVAYVYNGRTKQNMPINFQFYLNCINNSNRINLELAIKEIKIPILIVHGDNDPTVLVDQAYDFKNWNDKVDLKIIENADHVFGVSHPQCFDNIPIHLNDALDVTLKFLKQ